MAQQMMGMTAGAGALMVGIMGAFNGGGFSCMPSLVTELFGAKYLSQIRGYILVAWGIAGLIGPIIGAKIKEMTGNYQYMLYTYGAMFVVALLISLVLYKQNQSLKNISSK